MSILGMTADQIDGACNRLWEELTSGKTDEEARKELKLSHANFTLLKRKMVEREMGRLSERTAEETYIQYVMDQVLNIRDLTDMIKQFKSSKQYNAMVGAVKARADLNDKLLKMGQDLGVIAKQPQKHELVGGILVHELSNKDLKKMITGSLKGLSDLMKRHGGGNIIDITPGPTHVQAKKVKAIAGGKRMRVRKGRRRVIDADRVKTKVKAK